VAQGGQGYSLYTEDLPDPLVWEPSSYSTAQNASFEEETAAGEISHWHPFGAGSFESSSVYREGTKSAHFVRTAADTGNYSGFYQRYIQVQPDSTYYMGVWVKTANMTSGYVMPTLGVWENGHIVSIGYITEDTDWTYLSGSWTAAGDEDRIQIQLPCATNFVGEAWFDGLYFGTQPPPNHTPTAYAQSDTTDEDTALSITLFGSDPDGDPLSYIVVTNPTHGNLSGSGQTRTYTPSANYYGSDSFTFKVNDGTVDSDPATVSIIVNPVNDAPTANPQSVSTNEDQSKGITLTGSDIDGSISEYQVVSGPSHGTVTGGTGASRTYTPSANYYGSHSFTFKVKDDDGAWSGTTATVSITVNDVNDPPTATPQGISTNEDQSKTFTLSGNDIDGSISEYQVVDNPSHGSVTGGTGATRTYTPNTNYHGSDSFTFKVKDDDGAWSGTTATVSVTVKSVNDRPQVSDIPGQTIDEGGSFSQINLDGYVYDPDHSDSQISWTYSGNSSLSVSISNRVATISAPGGWAGSETITFRATDPGGLYDTDSATFTVVDATPPNTTITSPSNGSFDYDGNVTFCYAGSDNITPTSDLQYSYRLGGAWSSYTSSTSRNYPGLCGGSYTFEVKAKDGAQLVDPSPASVTICVVITPTGLSASAGNHYVDLSWNASCGATGYDIHYWRYNPYNYWVIDVGNVTNKRISGLTNGVKYYFRVRARTGCGTGAWSSYVTATPQDGCW